MRSFSIFSAGILAAAFASAPALGEPLIWGIQAEQVEYRAGKDTDALAWDFDAFIGSDELKLVWRSEGERALEDDVFETLENQVRAQLPISDFFDAAIGVRVDTPNGPDRVHGVFGLHGLAPQWFEIDADFFLSDNPSFRFEAEYEVLITNRIILTPAIELDLPLSDDRAVGVGAWGPQLEVGARLSYDLVDRTISPYLGLHYERVFGETADLARDRGEDADSLYFVVGARMIF